MIFRALPLLLIGLISLAPLAYGAKSDKPQGSDSALAAEIKLRKKTNEELKQIFSDVYSRAYKALDGRLTHPSDIEVIDKNSVPKSLKEEYGGHLFDYLDGPACIPYSPDGKSTRTCIFMVTQKGENWQRDAGYSTLHEIGHTYFFTNFQFEGLSLKEREFIEEPFLNQAKIESHGDKEKLEKALEKNKNYKKSTEHKFRFLSMDALLDCLNKLFSDFVPNKIFKKT